MNKTELIDAVAQATDLSKVSAGKAVDAVLSLSASRSKVEAPWS